LDNSIKMRHTFVVILALSLNTAVYSQVENIIYKKVIDEYVLNLRQPNIGFNKEHNQALIYYSFNSGAGVGGGFYMVCEKKRKKWKQKGFIPAWAS
jgi:hypothetical protein